MTLKSLQPKKLGRISLRPELSHDQTLSSFVSTVAAHNGFRSPGRFLKAMGINELGLRRGDVPAFDRLAAVTGASSERLLSAAALRTEKGFCINGQQFAYADLRRQSHVCPACVEEDRIERQHLRRHAGAKGRPWWTHALVNSCPKHELGLVPLPKTSVNSLIIGDLVSELRTADQLGVRLERVVRPSTIIDRYIADRFTQAKTSPLEAEPLDDVLFLSCFLGLPHTEGGMMKVPTGAEARLQPTEKGLEIAVSGMEAIRSRLLEIADAVNPQGACEIGLRRIYRSLFDKLDADLGLVSVRQLLVEIGIERHLIKFEDRTCLGLPVPERSLQSMVSARRRFGISERQLRASVIELGLLPKAELHRPARQILADFSEVEATLSELKTSLNLVSAAGLLGLLPQQLVKLCEDQVITPHFIRPSADLKPLRFFREEDLTAFLTTFEARAVRTKNDGLLTIWTAGLKACRQPTDVIAAIADGRISKIYRNGRIKSLHDVRLDFEDVRRGMHAQKDEDLLDADDCCSVLKINITAMRKILHAGILRPVSATNPVNLRKQIGVERGELEIFHESYASLNALSQEWARTPRLMFRALTDLRIPLAFPTSVTDVRLYCRRDVKRRAIEIEELLEAMIISSDVKKPVGASKRRSQL